MGAPHSYHDVDRPDTAARQLAAPTVDLQDDEPRELLHRGWGIVRAHPGRHVADAVAAGEPAAGAAGPDPVRGWDLPGQGRRHRTGRGGRPGA